jgi:hypothetical protein
MRNPSATLLMIVFAGLANAAVPRSSSAQVIERRPAVGLRSAGCRTATSGCNRAPAPRRELSMPRVRPGFPGQAASDRPASVPALAAVAARAQADTVQDPESGSMIGGGLAGAAVGLFAGGTIGYLASVASCSDSLCNVGYGVVGAVAGEAIGLAFGVHAANGGRGSFGADLLASTGAALIGLGAMERLGYGPGIGLSVTVILQLVVTAQTEARTSRWSP